MCTREQAAVAHGWLRAGGGVALDRDAGGSGALDSDRGSSHGGSWPPPRLSPPCLSPPRLPPPNCRRDATRGSGGGSSQPASPPGSILPPASTSGTCVQGTFQANGGARQPAPLASDSHFDPAPATPDHLHLGPDSKMFYHRLGLPRSQAQFRLHGGYGRLSPRLPQISGADEYNHNTGQDKAAAHGVRACTVRAKPVARPPWTYSDVGVRITYTFPLPSHTMCSSGTWGRLDQRLLTSSGRIMAGSHFATTRRMAFHVVAPYRSGGVVATAFLVISLGGCDLGTHAGLSGDGGAGAPADADNLPRADAMFVTECSACHGDQDSPAPPRDLSGGTATSSRGVGAHRSHLNPTPTWHSKIECGDCHTVPGTTDAPGHLDGDNVAELTWGARSRTGGSTPTWNATTCSNVYCHGSTLTGGALTEPAWTTVNGSQNACGTCHGFAPPAPHSQSTDCGACHPTIQPGTTTFLDPDSHINGRIEVTDGQACDACHGSGGDSAPPRDLAGNTARTAAGVGAHRNHLASSSWRREISCSNCHVVPTAVNAPGHIDGDNKAEVPFDSLNTGATYSPATTTCSGLYCHGNGRSAQGVMNWTEDVVMSCSSCHEDGNQGGSTMSGKHRKHLREGVRCSGCHKAVVDSGKNIIAPDLHINGLNDIQLDRGGAYAASTGRCSNMGCHGGERW